MPEKPVKKRIGVTLTGPYLEALDRLVQEGVYADRGGAIKDALRRLFRHYGIEPFVKPVEKTEKR